MTLRRKHSPSPIAKPDSTASRRVVSATARAFALPTVAALLACAAVACSAPSSSTDRAQADPVRKPIATNATTNATTGATTSATTDTTTSTLGGKPIVDPDPEVHAVKGEAAPVKPTPKPMPSTFSTAAPTPKPPHLGGAVAIVDTH